MPYNLPGPWDPGYALPDNVEDEGLERRGFVTKQMPRGTYDNPAVGDGGYDVPRYVKDEGYGQGTFTTKWAPSGTYAGPRIPPWLNQHPKVTQTRALPGGGRAVTMLAGFGDAELPPAFEDYGAKAARVMLARVQQVPAQQRQKTLKQIMDKVDPSLWGRSQQIWKRLIAQGMSPAQALPLAIARAMSTGLAAEVIDAGLRRAAPQAKSLLGLGCYGCLAVLGEDAPAEACTSTKGFSWVYGSAGIPGHWERTRSGATDVPFCPSGPPKGAHTVTEQAPEVRDHRATGVFYVGPFQFDDRLANRAWGSGTSEGTANRARSADLLYPSPDPSWRPSVQSGGITRLMPIDAHILKWLRDRLTEKTDSAGNTDSGTTYPKLVNQFGLQSSPDWSKWFDAMGISMSTPVRLHTLWYLLTGIRPLATTKHPNTGEDMVMHVMVHRTIPTQDGSASNPLALKVWLSRVPDPTVFASIWNTLIHLPATIVMAVKDAVVDTIKELADLACDVLNSSLQGEQGQAAGAAAATAAGLPPQAGAAGAAIAQNACKEPAPPPPPPPPVKSSLMTTLLLAGGAVAAVALLTRNR